MHSLKSMRMPLQRLREMYDPENVGGMFLPNMLGKKFTELLRNEVTETYSDGLFVEQPSQEGVVRQNMSTLYVGASDAPEGVRRVTLEDLPFVSALADRYTTLYNVVARATTHFEQILKINSVGIHRYPSDGGGIAFHRDYVRDKNLIAIFSVSGPSRITFAFTREWRGSVSYTTQSGDLVLMRSNVEDPELKQELRPFHRLETLGEERFSVIFRNR